MIGNSEVSYEDWFSRGQEDAWFGQSKCPPEQDPEAASLYDLGYSEGTIKRSPDLPRKDLPSVIPAAKKTAGV